VAWDNAGHYNGATWVMGPSLLDLDTANTDDTGDAEFQDLDPTSGGSVDTIYDQDYPGVSTLLHLNVIHNSEVYVNFTQFVTVTLDVPDATCSDNALWSYQAQVDVDKAAGSRIDLNQLGTGAINIPDAPHYGKK
jgi:hypothetical protein